MMVIFQLNDPMLINEKDKDMGHRTQTSS